MAKVRREATLSDHLLDLPDELLEAVLLRAPPSTTAALALVNRRLRGRIQRLERPWQRLCRLLNIPKGKSESWTIAYLDYVAAKHGLESVQEGLQRPSLRCLKDIFDVDKQCCKGVETILVNIDGETVRESQGIENAFIPSEAEKKRAKETIMKTTMAYAHNEQYFTFAHSTQYSGKTSLWAVCLTDPSQTLGRGEVPYELPFQHVFQWKSHFLYIPFPRGNAVLRACDVKNNFRFSGEVFSSSEDKLLPQNSWNRSVPDVYKASGPSRIFEFENRLLVVDVGHARMAKSSRKPTECNWGFHFVDLLDSSSGNIDFKMAKERYFRDLSLLELLQADQHKQWVALLFRKDLSFQDQAELIVVCVKTSAVWHHSLLLNETNCFEGRLLFSFSGQFASSNQTKLQAFENDADDCVLPEVIHVSRGRTLNSFGLRKPRISTVLCVANQLIHSLAVAREYSMAICQTGLEFIGICTSDLKIRWRVLPNDPSIPLCVTRFGLFVAAKVDSNATGLYDVMSGRCVNSNRVCPAIRRNLSEYASDWPLGLYAQASNDSGGYWDFVVLPPCGDSRESSWRLLIVHDLERFAPVAFDLLYLK